MSDEQALIERLADVPAIDVRLALRHLAWQVVVVERTLRHVAAEYGSGVPGLSEVDGVGDGEGGSERGRRCARACHSLRGALALIGAVDLAARAERLEDDIATGLPDGPRRARAAGLDADVRALAGQLAERL